MCSLCSSHLSCDPWSWSQAAHGHRAVAVQTGGQHGTPAQLHLQFKPWSWPCHNGSRELLRTMVHAHKFKRSVLCKHQQWRILSLWSTSGCRGPDKKCPDVCVFHVAKNSLLAPMDADSGKAKQHTGRFLPVQQILCHAEIQAGGMLNQHSPAALRKHATLSWHAASTSNTEKSAEES